jgi:hypothetical protein
MDDPTTERVALVQTLFATHTNMDTIVRAYAQAVTADARAENEARERQLQEQYTTECAELLAWVEERLPRFEHWLGYIDYEPSREAAPFEPRLRVRIGSQAFPITRRYDVPGSNVLVFVRHDPVQISLPADEPHENWVRFVQSIAVLSGELERAEIARPEEILPV